MTQTKTSLARGDLVLLRGVAARRWRGAVVEVRGVRVLVDYATTTGSTIQRAWLDEEELASAEVVEH